MKRILPFLAAMVAAPVLAAAPAKTIDTPADFKNEPPYVQNQVCGEMMANMARMSADLYAKTGLAPMRDAAIMAGTRAMVFVRANASLTAEEGERAKRIADQLERSASADKPAIGALAFCEARATRWMQEGVVTPADVKLAEDSVRTALDQAVKPPAKPPAKR